MSVDLVAAGVINLLPSWPSLALAMPHGVTCLIGNTLYLPLGFIEQQACFCTTFTNSMIYSVLGGCINGGGNGLSFFSFPKEKRLRRIWIEKVTFIYLLLTTLFFQMRHFFHIVNLLYLWCKETDKRCNVTNVMYEPRGSTLYKPFEVMCGQYPWKYTPSIDQLFIMLDVQSHYFTRS